MRDNPLHLRVFGDTPDKREQALTGMFAAVLRQYLTKGTILGASSSETLVGVCAMVEPGRCQPSTPEKLRLLPAILGVGGLASATRVVRWTARWSRHDPTEPHWHLGPVGVERQRQSQGIGSSLLAAFCARMDQVGDLAYLETDKQENVHFYERFGFRVSAEDLVLGVRNWFMERPCNPVRVPLV